MLVMNHESDLLVETRGRRVVAIDIEPGVFGPRGEMSESMDKEGATYALVTKRGNNLQVIDHTNTGAGDGSFNEPDDLTMTESQYPVNMGIDEPHALRHGQIFATLIG